jgi:hypothetical protein
LNQQDPDAADQERRAALESKKPIIEEAKGRPTALTAMTGPRDTKLTVKEERRTLKDCILCTLQIE